MIVVDNSRAMLQIVASLTEYSRGAVYNRNLFIVHATNAACACFISQFLLFKEIIVYN